MRGVADKDYAVAGSDAPRDVEERENVAGGAEGYKEDGHEVYDLPNCPACEGMLGRSESLFSCHHSLG